jgi:hypothetical protein
MKRRTRLQEDTEESLAFAGIAALLICVILVIAIILQLIEALIRWVF